MKLAVIADIHGNAPALEAVLDAPVMSEADTVVCLGDIVGALGSPGTCVSLVRQNADHVVHGNHDSRVFDNRKFLPKRDVDVFEYELIKERLSAANRTWLQDRPVIDKIMNGTVLAHCQPTPDRATGVGGEPGVYPGSFEEITDSVDDETKIVLLGHTHCQHAEVVGSDDQPLLVCNPGAVGLPVRVDGNGDAGLARYAVVETDTMEWALRSVQYDATNVVEFLRANGSPLGIATEH
jgi:predicted phosphodiesterase